MSEFSTSYHIRTDDVREVEKKLRAAKLSGIIFGPSHGWLSFVPYANAASYRKEAESQFAVTLSRVTELAVLYYCLAEDHGWTFALARPGFPLVQYGYWWDPFPTVERDKFDPLALAPFVSPELVEPLLGPIDRETVAKSSPADRFAELLGFPAYKWLSPDLAQDQTEDLLREGGRKLGTKPASLATQFRLPPTRHLALPHSDLTGREALEILLPFMAKFKAPWHLTALSSYGRIRPDGSGDWHARWRKGESGDTIEVALFGNGRLSFRGHTAPPNMLCFILEAMTLPSNGWLDSSDIALIVAQLPIPKGILQATLSLMCLRSFKDAPLAWEVHFHIDRTVQSQFESWTVYLDAITGEIISEQIGRREGYMVAPARQRVGGGEWEDINP